MIEVDEYLGLSAPAVLTALLNEFSAVTDYRTLRDSLPRRLAHLLNCRCVLLYQRLGETLQFAAGTILTLLISTVTCLKRVPGVHVMPAPVLLKVPPLGL